MHFKRQHWEIKNLKDILASTKLLDSIWAMKRKRKLNAHGGQQVHGINYWDT